MSTQAFGDHYVTHRAPIGIDMSACRKLTHYPTPSGCSSLCYSALVKVTFAFAAFLCIAFLPAAFPAYAQEDEIVANLAGGRTIILATNDAILFGAIEHPLEAKSVPPRVAALDNRHIGILFGASEWQIPSQPQPIRLDRDIARFAPPDRRYAQPGEADQDLEQIGVAFLEKLRPLVSQLHHKIELKPNEPLFLIILIGYAPQDYGPEVWRIEYSVEQSLIPPQTDYWQTHLLRPRFTQLYPPEKHQPKTLMEIRFPEDLSGIPLLGLMQQGDPSIDRFRTSNPRISRVFELIQKGESQKADTVASTEFLRDVLPILAGDATFILGKVGETSGFEWIVPPTEPRLQEETTQDKNRPPDAPTLMRKPKP